MKRDRQAIIVNLYGAPGAGKSTGASYIFSKLKMRDVNAELVTEFAKDKVWEENPAVFRNQAYIFGKQSFKISRCADKVDVIITDSPLPLSILYNNDPRLTENFNNAVMDFYEHYQNYDYLIIRDKPYNPEGRFQTEEESDAMVGKFEKMLEERGIAYTRKLGNTEAYDDIILDIMMTLKARNII